MEEEKLLLVLVMEGNIIKNSVIPLSSSLRDEDILNLNILLNSTLNGLTVEEIAQIEDQVDHLEKKLQQSHVDRLTRNECTPAAGMIFSDICSGLERVADHATNIAFCDFWMNDDAALFIIWWRRLSCWCCASSSGR